MDIGTGMLSGGCFLVLYSIFYYFVLLLLGVLWYPHISPFQYEWYRFDTYFNLTFPYTIFWYTKKVWFHQKHLFSASLFCSSFQIISLWNSNQKKIIIWKTCTLYKYENKAAISHLFDVQIWVGKRQQKLSTAPSFSTRATKHLSLALKISDRIPFQNFENIINLNSNDKIKIPFNKKTDMKHKYL